MAQILKDEKLLRYAVACGMGQQIKWTKGSDYKNRMEPEIATL